MTVAEVQRETEAVEHAVNKNIDLKDVQGLIAKGVWQCALQLAKLVNGVEQTK